MVPLSTVSGYKARVIKVDSGETLRTIEYDFSVSSVAFSPNCEILATGSSYDDNIRLIKVDTGEVLHKIKENRFDSVISIAFSPDGALLATGSNYSLATGTDYKDVGSVGIIKVDTGEVLDTKDTDKILSLKFSQNGALLLMRSDDCKAHIYRCLTDNL